MFSIREEQAEDAAAIRHVNQAAFGRVDEALLVAKLRKNGSFILSLVAISEERVVGHILFSPMRVVAADGAVHMVAGLGPLAVVPAHQGIGIGSALCRKGIELCREMGQKAVLVLGHPGYYPRFGFRAAEQFGITCALDVPKEAFMALALRRGALRAISGVAYYLPEFDAL